MYKNLITLALLASAALTAFLRSAREATLRLGHQIDGAQQQACHRVEKYFLHNKQ